MNEDPVYSRDFGTKTCDNCMGCGHLEDDDRNKQCPECEGFGEVEMSEEEHMDWLESKKEELREKN